MLKQEDMHKERGIMKISLFASAVRPKLWPALFKSLESNTEPHEIVFAGNNGPSNMNNHPGIIIIQDNFKYVNTFNIKPAQCYEIARRHCTGEVVVWTADDVEYPNDIIGKSYRYWKSKNNKKLILSLQTKETGYGQPNGQVFDMNVHRFFGGRFDTPLMAPIGMMSREWLEELGGLDKRYVSGQYENDIVMRALQYGATVEIFGDKNTYVDIDHLGKSIAIGESKDQNTFLKRPFASSYKQDRAILENSWTTFDRVKAERVLREASKPLLVSSLKDVSPLQLDTFQPYEDDNILTKSQSNKGQWE